MANWIAAATVANRRHHNHNRGHHSSKKSYTNTTKTSPEKKGFDYIDCLQREWIENPELLEFFCLISDEYRKIAEEEISKLETEMQEEFKQSEEKKVYFLKLKEELIKLGINIELNLAEDIEQIAPSEAFYDNYTSFFFPGYSLGEIPFRCFHGEKSLKMNDKSRFVEQEKNECAIKLSELNLDLKKLQNKIYLLPSKRKENKEKIEKIHKDIENYTKIYEEWCKTTELYKKIETLPPYIDDLFSKSATEAQERIKIRGSVLNKKKRIEDMKQPARYYDYILELAIDKMKKEGKLTENILKKVYLQMSKVEIKRLNQEYDPSQDIPNSIKEQDLNELIIWFINNMYKKDSNYAEDTCEMVSEDSKKAR